MYLHISVAGVISCKLNVRRVNKFVNYRKSQGRQNQITAMLNTACVSCNGNTIHSNAYFTPPTRPRQDCIVLSVNRIGDKSRLSVTGNFDCFVQSRNAVRTNENSVDLSTILFTSPTRQDKTFLSCPCQWCNEAWPKPTVYNRNITDRKQLVDPDDRW